MRYESLPVRSSHKSPSSSSLPDEANGSRFSTTHCDTDIEVVQDTFDVPQKKRHCLGTNRVKSVPLISDGCIVCGILDKRVSRCSGNGCVISYHGECLDAEDLANTYYCPYCWFNLVAFKFMSAREQAVGAEKSVSAYLDKEMANVPGDKELQPEKDATYSSEEEEVQVEKDSGQSRGEKLPSDNRKGKRRRWRRQMVIDSDISSNESTNGEDVTEQITSSVPSSEAMKQERRNVNTADKSKTVREMKDQRKRLFWTSEEEEMLKV